MRGKPEKKTYFIYQRVDGDFFLAETLLKREQQDNPTLVAKVNWEEREFQGKKQQRIDNVEIIENTELGIEDNFNKIQNILQYIAQTPKNRYPYLEDKDNIIVPDNSGKKTVITYEKIQDRDYFSGKLEEKINKINKDAKSEIIEQKKDLKTAFFKFKDDLKNKLFEKKTLNLCFTLSNAVDQTLSSKNLTECRDFIRDRVEEVCATYGHNPEAYKEKIQELITLNNKISKHFDKPEGSGRVHASMNKLLKKTEELNKLQSS